jgi:hypothetical protein
LSGINSVRELPKKYFDRGSQGCRIICSGYMRTLFISSCLIGVCRWAGAECPGLSQPLGAEKIAPSHLSTLDRVRPAAADGRISLKEVVLLEARFLYAPPSIPPDSPFAPRPGETPAREECGTGFYAEVRQVLPQMTPEERAWLVTLSPDLRLQVRPYEKNLQK